MWTLEANAPRWREPTASRADLAAMLGLLPEDLAAGPPLWVDTGSDQLVIPLATTDAVRRAAPQPDLMLAHGSNGQRAMAYIWAPDPDASARIGSSAVLARFFFPKQGMIAEDPGTGSACANLGGWLLATQASLPQHVVIAQGGATGRPCALTLEVTADRRIRVSGRVIELATRHAHAVSEPQALHLRRQRRVRTRCAARFKRASQHRSPVRSTRRSQRFVTPFAGRRARSTPRKPLDCSHAVPRLALETPMTPTSRSLSPSGYLADAPGA